MKNWKTRKTLSSSLQSLIQLISNVIESLDHNASPNQQVNDEWTHFSWLCIKIT